MSWKAVDLQMAVHKNSEAALRQSQMQHKPVVDQELLAGANQKMTELQRHKSGKVDETTGLTVRDDGGRHGDGKPPGQGNNKKRQPQQKAESASEHPYKGHHIDLSL